LKGSAFTQDVSIWKVRLVFRPHCEQISGVWLSNEDYRCSHEGKLEQRVHSRPPERSQSAWAGIFIAWLVHSNHWSAYDVQRSNHRT